MTWHCAEKLDAGESVKDESAMTKVFVSEAVYRVADRAAQIMGALGMSEDTPVSLILRELRPFRIYDGASGGASRDARAADLQSGRAGGGMTRFTAFRLYEGERPARGGASSR